MPFIGNAGQVSNIFEKNYATTTLRIVEGDTLFQSYNPADSHYKLITDLEQVTRIGARSSNTVNFTNRTTGLTASSNVGVANTNPEHTLDVGTKFWVDMNEANTVWVDGTVFATEYGGDTMELNDSITVRDVLVDRVYPKTNGFVELTSNIGLLNTAPIHTLDIGANVQIDEYGSNTFWTSGNVYAEHFKSSNVTVSGSVDTDELIINNINSKDTDFVNFTSNVGLLNTAPIHTLDIGANVQIDEYGSNTFWTSGNVYANKYTGSEIAITGTIVASDFILSGGSQSNPTPQLQTISEVNPPIGQIAFSSDRTLTLSNVTTALDATNINAITTHSNLIGDNVTAVTVHSNLIGNNVTAVTVNSNLIGNNVTAVTVNSNLIGNNVTAVTVHSNLIGNNVTAVTVNSNLIGNNVTAVTVNSNLIGNNVTAVTVNSNLIGNNVITTNDITGGTTFYVKQTTNRVGINKDEPGYALDVVGDINFSGDFYQGGEPFVSSLWTSGADSLYYRSNVEVGTADLFVDTTTGRVGVGTAQPRAVLDLNDVGAMIVPVGTASERPSTAVEGMLRYNSETGYLEAYTAGGWGSIATPPTITSFSPSVVIPAVVNGTDLTIIGAFFDENTTVQLRDSSGTLYSTTNLVFTNSGIITVTLGSLALDSYTLVMTNGAGLSVDSTSKFDVNTLPVWISPADGAALEFSTLVSYTTTLSATDPDGGTITYSLVSGTLPPGLTLSGSTISGTSGASDGTLTPITIRASDGAVFTDRSFMIKTIAPLFSFSSHTFTNAGATGRTGPTLTQLRNVYNVTWDDNINYFTMFTPGIQGWTVPSNGTYQIDAYGATGGYAYLNATTSISYGGRGARNRGTFTLVRGHVLKILVGQMGVNNPRNSRGGGGGGATFVYNQTTSTLLIVAGGGGGGGQYARPGTADANPTSTSGNNGALSGGSGGSGGDGGAATVYVGGGAGWFTDGGGAQNPAAGGTALNNGGIGGALHSDGVDGGFGGGGGSYAGAGGGAGYSGGGGGGWSNSGHGGGGGSYIDASAANILRELHAVENTNGKVIITVV